MLLGDFGLKEEMTNKWRSLAIFQYSEESYRCPLARRCHRSSFLHCQGYENNSVQLSHLLWSGFYSPYWTKMTTGNFPNSSLSWLLWNVWCLTTSLLPETLLLLLNFIVASPSLWLLFPGDHLWTTFPLFTLCSVLSLSFPWPLLSSSTTFTPTCILEVLKKEWI